MSYTKHAPKRKKRGRRAVPLLGVAGMSLALASGASARTSGSGPDIRSDDTAARHEITLNEEEISDVSLATFYVFDKENARTPKVSEKLAWGCRGCGCGGCRGRGGCGGALAAEVATLGAEVAALVAGVAAAEVVARSER